MFTVSVVLTSDENLALPMSVCIASVLKNRSQGRKIDIHVLSCGIRSRSRRRVEDNVAAQPDARLFWHDIGPEQERLLQQRYVASSRPYPPAAYARLLIGDLLPFDLERVIYLDSDTLVLTDLSPLWEMPLNGASAAVVRDLPDPARQAARLKSSVSAADRLRFGLDEGSADYFQSGVMLFDLAAMRGSLAAEAFRVLADYPQLNFPDQDALNLVMTNGVVFVDPRWNQMSSVFWYKADDPLPYAPELFENLQSRPFIVHYSGRPKPWEPDCKHPLAQDWRNICTEAGFDAPAKAMTHWTRRIPRARRMLVKRVSRALRLA